MHILITGTESGIGRHLAQSMASCQGHVVLCGDRTCSIQGDNVEWIPLDLSRLESVRKAAEWIMSKNITLDRVILNAGIMACPFERTVDGYEQQLQVNYLGHHLLVSLLLPSLRKAKGARVIWVSSVAHLLYDATCLDFDVLYKENIPERDIPFRYYYRSKFFVLLGAWAWSRRLVEDGITVLALHPGTFHSNLFQCLDGTYGTYMARLVRFVGSWILSDVSLGSRRIAEIVHASEDRLRHLSSIYVERGLDKAWMHPKAGDTELQDQIWMWAEQVTKMSPNILDIS